MVFYENETAIGLAIASLPALGALYFFFIREFKPGPEPVILNTRPYENIELMFFHHSLAYHWYPPENTLDSLHDLGHRFAAFDYKNDSQQLPPYILNNPQVYIIPDTLK